MTSYIGSMSNNRVGKREIRKAIIDADLVDCMVALPGQPFNSTPIPVGLWFLAKNNAVEFENDARLFGGETELSLVA